MTAELDERPTTLRELAWLFGKLGCTAFGGPAAHIAWIVLGGAILGAGLSCVR